MLCNWCERRYKYPGALVSVTRAASETSCRTDARWATPCSPGSSWFCRQDLMGQANCLMRLHRTTEEDGVIISCYAFSLSAGNGHRWGCAPNISSFFLLFFLWCRLKCAAGPGCLQISWFKSKIFVQCKVFVIGHLVDRTPENDDKWPSQFPKTEVRQWNDVFCPNKQFKSKYIQVTITGD